MKGETTMWTNDFLAGAEAKSRRDEMYRSKAIDKLRIRRKR